MDEQHRKLYEDRKARCETAATLGVPDRVPNSVRIGFLPEKLAGMNGYECISDHERVAQLHYEFYERYPQFDTAGMPGYAQVARANELLQPKNAHWPGDGTLDVDNTYQFIEYPTMLEDEYDLGKDHPAEFFLTKALPRTYKWAEPLADIDWIGQIARPGVILNNPKLIDACRRIVEASEENDKQRAAYRTWGQKLDELGFYSFSGGLGGAAFDLVGDTLRGTMGIMVDIIEQRDKVVELMEAMQRDNLKSSVGMCKAMGVKYCWTMLHKGFDGFISDEDYAELYWPYLREWIMTLVENDITPIVYTEGSYTTRLKYLRDVPEGKVIYHFEQVDIKEAKKQLEGIAAIMGCFPEYTLHYGSKQDVIDKVKATLDVLAPGGGYIFSTGYSVDVCPRENLEACLETVEEYGKY